MLNWNEFFQIAKKSFEWLIIDFNFKCISEKCPFVVYSNGKTQVSIFFDADRNGELDLGLERCEDVGKAKPFFRIEQFKRVHANTYPRPRASVYLGSREDAIRELNNLSTQLNLYCNRVLMGDMTDFNLIEKNASM